MSGAPHATHRQYSSTAQKNNHEQHGATERERRARAKKRETTTTNSTPWQRTWQRLARAQLERIRVGRFDRGEALQRRAHRAAQVARAQALERALAAPVAHLQRGRAAAAHSAGQRVEEPLQRRTAHPLLSRRRPQNRGKPRPHRARAPAPANRRRHRPLLPCDLRSHVPAARAPAVAARLGGAAGRAAPASTVLPAELCWQEQLLCACCSLLLRRAILLCVPV